MAPCHLVPFHFPYFPFHFLHSLEARTPHPGVTLIFARSVALPRCSFCSLAAVTFRHFPLPNMHHQSEQFRAERVTSQASGRVSNEETLASCRSPLFVRSDFVFFPHKRTKEATRGLGGHALSSTDAFPLPCWSTTVRLLSRRSSRLRYKRRSCMLEPGY